MHSKLTSSLKNEISMLFTVQIILKYYKMELLGLTTPQPSRIMPRSVMFNHFSWQAILVNNYLRTEHQI
jgi:hypothetical protein